MDEIDWSQVEGAYSQQVKHFPTLLQAMTSPIAAVRRSALGTILGEIEHQGSIYPATGAVMPFLLRLLAHPNVEPGKVLGSLVYVVEWAAAGSEDEKSGTSRTTKTPKTPRTTKTPTPLGRVTPYGRSNRGSPRSPST
ncbi:MAG: hypothetical protein ABMA64_06665 [Myxococcota bacterium]